MLWVDNATAAQMKPFADKLDTDVAKLVALVKTGDYQTAQIANGAKSLMDEIGASQGHGRRGSLLAHRSLRLQGERRRAGPSSRVCIRF